MCVLSSVLSDSWDPIDLPDSSVHGILQAKILVWVAISFIPDPGMEPRFPALQADSLPTDLHGKGGGGAENLPIEQKHWQVFRAPHHLLKWMLFWDHIIILSMTLLRMDLFISYLLIHVLGFSQIADSLQEMTSPLTLDPQHLAQSCASSF